MLIFLSFCLVVIQWKSECDDNKKADADTADTADNDNRITNMGQGERSGEQSEQEMSEWYIQWYMGRRAGDRGRVRNRGDQLGLIGIIISE